MGPLLARTRPGRLPVVLVCWLLAASVWAADVEVLWQFDTGG